jgi:NADH pyrophosphatase NudC (nudix superfamily)
MDIASIFLILALTLFVLWFVARPFLQPGVQHVAVSVVSPEEHERSSLLAERDRLLTALQELDSDYSLGKVPEADYPVQRAALLQHGADILRQMDSLSTLSAPAASGSPSASDPLEAAIDARRANMQTSDDPVEAAIAARRRDHQGQSAGFCPKCGKPLQKSDRFCPKCGANLV